MKNQHYEWYLVKFRSGKYRAFIFDDYEEALFFAKDKHVKYKGFHTKEEAAQYARYKESRICFVSSKDNSKSGRPPRICLTCEKPFKGKTKLCPLCNKARRSLPFSMSVGAAVTIKRNYPNNNPFSLVSENPSIFYEMVRSTDKYERAKNRRDRSEEVADNKYINAVYSKEATAIPDYIKRLFDNDNMKEFLYLEGNRINPQIYYRCRRCGMEQCQSYESLRTNHGHNCQVVKSKGEIMVDDFLKENRIQYNTQYDTLSCVNPKTKKVMPYDFELPSEKVIIEVQGAQHFDYIPYFHGSIENFEYQLWKDEYKKQFAEKNGYRMVYLDYNQIENGQYRRILEELIEKPSTSSIAAVY